MGGAKPSSLSMLVKINIQHYRLPRECLPSGAGVTTRACEASPRHGIFRAWLVPIPLPHVWRLRRS